MQARENLISLQCKLENLVLCSRTQVKVRAIEYLSTFHNQVSKVDINNDEIARFLITNYQEALSLIKSYFCDNCPKRHSCSQEP